MYKFYIFINLFFLIFSFTNAQEKQKLAFKIDSLIATKNIRFFNGVIIIAHKNKIIYEKTQGFADMEAKKPLNFQNKFIIGSVSKQITAVIILQLVDKKWLDLHTPIKKYLPKITKSWADSVTIHHLLNHTSGFVDIEKPLSFPVGSKFSYSNVAYNLLGQIAENVSQKSFETLMNGLFKQCKMKNSTSIHTKNRESFAKGYVLNQNNTIKEEIHGSDNKNIPAAFMVSNVKDLWLWNKNLHQGKLLSKKSYELMTKTSSVRLHPIFGELDYGYGVQMDKSEQLFEIGHGGYATGFATVNFYYPATKTSIIITENIDFQDETFKKTFFFETEIRKIIRENLLRIDLKK